MTRITWCSVAFLAFLLAAFGSFAEPPVVTQVEPKQGFVDADTPVAIHGAGFEPQAKVALLPGGLVGGVSTPGDARSVAVSGRYAYVADGGLQVIDISNPASPVLVGTAAMQHGGAHAVAVAGTHAYVTGVEETEWPGGPGRTQISLSGWLGIVDVSDPASPRELGSLERSGYCWWSEYWGGGCRSYFAGGVAVSEGYAFLTLYGIFGQDFDLEIVDVSDPAAPQWVGSEFLRSGYYGLISPLTPSDVAVSGTHAFVAAMESELYIVDVSDPASPSLEATYATPGNAMGVIVSGTRAFVAGGDSGLSIIDVSNPAAPSLVGIVNTVGWAQHVAVSGDTAFVAGGEEPWSRPEHPEVVVIDVSDPAVPTLLCRHSTPGEGAGVAVAGGYAFVADGPAGLQITDGQCAGSGLVGSYDALGGPQDIELSGNHAFVADGGAGLQILDVNNPAAPSRLAGVGLPNSARSVAVSGNYAYVAVADVYDYESSSSLQIVDVADPAAPSVVGALDAPNRYANDVAVAGSHAYVAADVYDYYAGKYSGYLQIVDVSSPAAPTVVADLETGCASGIAVSGTYAYLANGCGALQIIDVSAPSTPMLGGSVGMPGSAGSVFLSGSYAYVASGDGGLQIVDVGNPAAPTLIGGIATGGNAVRVVVRDDLAYVVNDTGSLVTVDVSNPAQPSLVTRQDTRGSARSVALAGDLAFVVGPGSGLEVLRPNPPLRDVAWSSGEAMTATVPAGYPPGSYDLRVTNQEPEGTTLLNAFRACTRRALDVRLAPWLPPIPRGAPAPVERSPITWRLEVDGDAEFVCPRPRHEADLLLPALPPNLEVQHGPAAEPGTIRIELLLVPEKHSGVVRLLADDPEAADALWATISAAGRIEVPRDDARHYAELSLGVTRDTPVGDLRLPDPDHPAPTSGPVSSIRGNRPPSSGARPQFASYEYRFAAGALTGASSSGPAADLVFEVVGRDSARCETTTRVSFAEAFGVGRSWVIGEDLDGDGVGDFTDNCPVTANPDQADGDRDGWGDACDTCPAAGDPDQADADHDAVGDACDSCVSVMNACQTDRDGDGPGDECDNCPDTANTDQADGDGDRRGDACDNCPAAANFGQSDLDWDHFGDVCDPCTDTDRDGFANPGFPASTCPVDNCPAARNPDQADNVHPNGIGDACDDPDGDGIVDLRDNCPDVVNPGQEDTDGDGSADACDPCTDTDGDGFGSPGFPASTCPVDNCPYESNIGQENRDNDRLGDVCDPYPDHALVVVPVVPDYGVVGEPVMATYRLQRRDTGELVTALAGVRTTLTLSGSAVFGASASAGLLISGGGMNRALVEFVGGLVTLTLNDATAEVVQFSGEDSEGNDLVFQTDFEENFEGSDGGFTHEGANDSWQWGRPSSGPGRAHSGTKVWATNLAGNYPNSCSASLYSPRLLTAAGTHPVLEFWDWFQAEWYYDHGRIQISSDRGVTWDTLDDVTFLHIVYVKRSYDLSAYAGREIQVRFWLISDGSVNYPGWYIDDFAIRGVVGSTEFLAPGGDTSEAEP